MSGSRRNEIDEEKEEGWHDHVRKDLPYVRTKNLEENVHEEDRSTDNSKTEIQNNN